MSNFTLLSRFSRSQMMGGRQATRIKSFQNFALMKTRYTLWSPCFVFLVIRNEETCVLYFHSGSLEFSIVGAVYRDRSNKHPYAVHKYFINISSHASTPSLLHHFVLVRRAKVYHLKTLKHLILFYCFS